MADNTTELEVLDQIVDVLGGQSGQYETVVPTLQQILALLGGGGGGSGSGYNPSLSVGRADALTGADETTQWAQRVTAGSGAATVRSVQGAAVVWNQLNVGANAQQVAGLTRTISADGGLTISGTVAETPTYNNLYLGQTVSFKRDGTKYLIKLSKPITQNIYISGFASTIDVHQSFIWFNADGLAPWNGIVSARVEAGDVVDIEDVHISVFDLTAMFGAGNEPTTVAEFERMYPEPYYPYSAPTLKPVQIAGIASTDAQGNELDAIEWTAQTLRAAGSVTDVLYSDHVDVNVGVYTFTGTETLQSNNWRPTEDTFAVAFPVALLDAQYPTSTEVISDVRMAELETIAYTDAFDGTKTGVCLAPTPQASSYSLFVRVPKTLADNKDTLMAWLAGKTIFYALATPTTTPISPALPMSYKVQQGGSESIIVPDGEISAAPILTVAEGKSAASLVMDALSCIAAPDGPTATANHAQNTYLTMGGKLYKVTSAIAVGESIIAGTNVTQTTVMAELIARTA